MNKRVLLITRARSARAKQRAANFTLRLDELVGDNAEVQGCEISELFFELSFEQVAIYHPEKKFDLRDFDLVVVRHIGKLAVEASAIAGYCQHFGVKYTDNYLNRLLPDNKIANQSALWFTGIKSFPRTFYGSVPEMKRRLSELGGKAVLKDEEGSKGRLNFVVSSPEEIDKIINQNPESQFLLQEFIPNDSDLRVLVLNGKVAMIIKRTGGKSSHLNNTSQGGVAEIIPTEQIDKAIIDLSIKAAAVLKLEVAGVDVMINSETGEVFLLEVNNAPQISSGSFLEEKLEVYSKMVRDLVNDEK